MPLLAPVPSPEVAAITLAAVEGLCTNCDHPLGEPRPRFCPSCGQETNIKAPTVGEFAQQFSGTYFASEGALWRTFKMLLMRPGELTAQYLNGRRKHYVLPLRLFLSISLVMLLTMRVVGALQFSTLDDPEFTKTLPARPAAIALELGFARAGIVDGTFFCEGLPPWLCKRLQRRMDTSTEALLASIEKASDRVASHAGLVMFVLLPAFALGLAFFFRWRGFSFTEHLVFALHLHAFWFLVVAVMMVGIEWLVWLGLLLIPAYAALAFRRVYGGPPLRLAVRVALLTVVHGTLVVVTAALVALAALLL
jgi:Protein of unknown function (DUF3667)